MRQSLRAVCPGFGSVLGVALLGSQLALVTGCGGHSATPPAPSGTSAPAASPAPAPGPAPSAAGATISGTVASTSSSPAGLIVGVEGTGASSIADAGGNFALNNVPPADVVLTFSAPGVSASAPVGAVAMNEVVQVSVTVNATVATIDSQQRTAPDNAVEAYGTLADLDVAGRQFKMGSTLVQVASSAVIKRADAPIAFADLKNGDRVLVRGMKDGAVVRASEVLAEASTHPPAPAPEPDVTLNGVLSGLGGTCPALAMSVAGTAVKTNSATVFNAKACGELKNGDTVYAIGPKQSDGGVLASKISYVAPTPPPDVTVTGAVSGFAGTCPSVSMTVGGTVVKTNSSTTYSGKGCSVLQNGDAVSAVGAKQSDGSLLATKITYTGPPAPVDVTLNGALSGRGGTCPALAMSVGGTAGKTNSASVFSGKECGELKNGDTVYAIGPKQSDGSVLASKIYYVTPPASEQP